MPRFGQDPSLFQAILRFGQDPPLVQVMPRFGQDPPLFQVLPRAMNSAWKPIGSTAVRLRRKRRSLLVKAERFPSTLSEIRFPWHSARLPWL
mmetsp:Transcript_15197/g.33398  ORF Transcript_15197/g.33398 Transcript_15197/m.33398 type:complete len:92 (-) Transcript_15197:24-299(-)